MVVRVSTLPETNSEFTPEKWMVGRKKPILSFWVERPIFRGKLAVSFRECSWVGVFSRNMVDGRNPANQLIVVNPIIYKLLYIPGGAGFLPSTV